MGQKDVKRGVEAEMRGPFASTLICEACGATEIVFLEEGLGEWPMAVECPVCRNWGACLAESRPLN